LDQLVAQNIRWMNLSDAPYAQEHSCQNLNEATIKSQHVWLQYHLY
jgi:hypothetical protein